MNRRLNQKLIKEMCGTVSYKKGEAFYRGNKVTFLNYSPTSCEAIVIGNDDFYVTIENKDREFKTTCSCPKLSSFHKECQHVAAVLLAIYEHQQKGSIPILHEEDDKDKNDLTNDLLTIFNKEQTQRTVKQSHFENRTVLEIGFHCKLLQVPDGKAILGIEVHINSKPITKLRDFLFHVYEVKSYELTSEITYNPDVHCFENETALVLQQLFKRIHDEEIYQDTFPSVLDESILFIPPSAWAMLLPNLQKTPMITYEYEKQFYRKLEFSAEGLQLRFDFIDTKEKTYQLSIHGIDACVFINPYHLVLTKEHIIHLKREDFKRLLELKQMVEATGKNEIPISEKQVYLFLEKVVPGLKQIGDVHISNKIQERYKAHDLVAKLYLDRLNNRLLAGIEFQYEHIIINPLERNGKVDSVILRDSKKEKAILELMDEGKFTKTESGYFLQNEELEYEFLHHIVPKLQNLVQIYATTAVRNRLLKVAPQPRIRIKVNKDRMNWLEFKFELDGIHEKHIREVLQALEEKRKYYRLKNGTLFSLETREYDEIRRFLQDVSGSIDDLEDGIQMPIIKGIALMDSFENKDRLVIEDTFRKFLEEIQHPEKLDYLVPKGLETVLRDYQVKGYKWLKVLAHYGFGGILADSMGLGKTIQSIAFIASELSNMREKKTPTLIVCPSSLTYNWLSEFMKFAPDIQAVVIDGSVKERMVIQKEIRDMDVVITSYPLIRKDSKAYEKYTFHTIFFDEAQAFKNPNSQTAKLVKKLQAKNRFALTGTPVENSIEELWSIYHVVFPELFQGLKEYSQLTRKTISRRIKPFLLRRLKEDVLSELPEKNEALESTELLPEQKQLYAAYLAKLKHDTFKHLDKETIRKNRIKILAGITRLRQICCHPALFVDGYKGSSAKLDQLISLIQEAKASGRRVLIFSQFTKMLGLIGRELAQLGYPFFYLDGQTPAEERLAICNRFNEGERDLFLISLKAGGTGLNLTGADTVILYDIWWNPAVEAQAADRAHRIGQTKVVQVIKLVARGTIEEKMNELQEKKRQLIDEIIDPKRDSSYTLTEEDIQELLL